MPPTPATFVAAPIARRVGRYLAEKAKGFGRGVARQAESAFRLSADKAKYLKEGERPAFEALKRFAKRPAKGAAESYKAMAPGERALFAGLTGLEVPGALQKGPGREERVGRTLGGAGGWLAMRKVPMAGWILGQMAGEEAGGLAGRAAGKIRGGR